MDIAHATSNTAILPSCRVIIVSTSPSYVSPIPSVLQAATLLQLEILWVYLSYLKMHTSIRKDANVHVNIVQLRNELAMEYLIAIYYYW